MSKTNERIIVVTYIDENGDHIADYGIGERSMRHITLPSDSITKIGAKFDALIGEFVIS